MRSVRFGNLIFMVELSETKRNTKKYGNMLMLVQIKSFFGGGIMDILWFTVIILCPFMFFYLLYINGYCQLSCKRALLFLGSRGNSYKSHHKATFAACSGYIKRILKLKENGEYMFVLDSAISKGNMTIDILNSKKDIVLTLNNNRKEGVIKPIQSERHYLVLRFDKAEGNYELNWKEKHIYIT